MSTSDVKTWRPLEVVTSYWLFSGSSLAVFTPTSDVKAWRPLEAVTSHYFFLMPNLGTPIGDMKTTWWAWLMLRPFGLEGKPMRPKVVQERGKGLAAKVRVFIDPSFYASSFSCPSLIALGDFICQATMYLWKFAILNKIKSSCSSIKHTLIHFFCHTVYTIRSAFFFFGDFAVYSLYPCGQGIYFFLWFLCVWTI